MKSDMSSVSFQPETDPRVSVVVLGWKSAPHLLGCLRSLSDNVGRIPYEVVVALNAPSDELLGDLGAEVSGVKVVVSTANRGFGGGCNMGVIASRGEYVVLLNDDTEVQPGWLEALVDTADQYPTAGAVGGKVFDPAGNIQEAGAIVWNDGTTTALGEVYLPADRAAFDELRQVDYCGGESLLIRRAIWDAVGGLSDLYYPAYFEDVDLCFKIAARGKNVLYQPAARVVHRGGSSTSPRFRSWIAERSRNAFVDRWSLPLAQRPPRRASDPDAVLQSVQLMADAPHPLWHQYMEPGFENIAEPAPPSDDDAPWFAREAALLAGYVESIECEIDRLEIECGTLRSSAQEREAVVAERTTERDEALQDLTTIQLELADTRHHMMLVENRMSYRLIDSATALLSKHPVASRAIWSLTNCISRKRLGE